MALNRLRSIEAKMRRDPAFGAQYEEQIAGYLAKSYARQLTPAVAGQRDGRTWYLPHYVDDFLSSFSTADEAIATTIDVVDVHKSGWFELRGFVSNSRAVLEALGKSAVSNGDSQIRHEPEMTPAKILGMTWSTSTDTFVFQTRFSRVYPDVVDGQRRPTKREVLSTSKSVFDPFELLWSSCSQ